MGTRGAVGFRFKGQDKIAFNQFDSYVHGLGYTCLAAVPKFLQNLSMTESQIYRLQEVDANTPPPTAEQQQALNKVLKEKTDDWCEIIYQTRGRPTLILAAGYYHQSLSFLADSLFCECAYIFNFDEMVLECYRGFQDVKHHLGRYADLPVEAGSRYYPVALVGTIPFELVGRDLDQAKQRMHDLFNEPNE